VRPIYLVPDHSDRVVFRAHSRAHVWCQLFLRFPAKEKPCTGSIPCMRALQYAKQINSNRSIVELNSTALSAVPGPKSTCNRQAILQYFLLAFPKLLLYCAKFKASKFGISWNINLNKAVGIHKNNLDREGLNICRPAVIKYGVLFTTRNIWKFYPEVFCWFWEWTSMFILNVIIRINLKHVRCVLHAVQYNFLYIFQVIFNIAPYLGLS